MGSGGDPTAAVSSADGGRHRLSPTADAALPIADRLALLRLVVELGEGGHAGCLRYGAVIEAADAGVALWMYGKSWVDVLFVDLHAPGEMEAGEFIRQLKRQHPEARVVAMSARRSYGVSDPAALAKQLGATALLAPGAGAADEAKLRARIYDPLASNPDTRMPPCGKHQIITDEELEAIVAYLYTL